MLRSYKKQRGVMLLEAMIGVLLFSIGIIGIMGLQAKALATVSDTKYRSEAAFLTENFISNIQSNASYARNIKFSPVLAAPYFPVVTVAGVSPYTMDATYVSGGAAAPTIPIATPPAVVSSAQQQTYIQEKMVYDLEQFSESLNILPGSAAHPPIVTVTPCVQSTWTAASLCPAPTIGVLGNELYGAVV